MGRGGSGTMAARWNNLEWKRRTHGMIPEFREVYSVSGMRGDQNGWVGLEICLHLLGDSKFLEEH